MQAICQNHWCKQGFEITSEDMAFYEKVSPVFGGKKELIPPPTLCPDCRQQRRLCWRNERHLYHRTCDATGKMIISNYSADKPFPMYDKAYWFSDKWDTRDYSRDYDFSKTFFANFQELQRAVPRFLVQQQETMENSDYCNFASNCKDCYLIFDSDYCRDSLYGNVLKHCENCVDCSFVSKCQLCYECIDCKRCYNLEYSRNCDNCSDSVFLENCIGCRNCAFSINLSNAEYVFANKQMAKAEYEQSLSDMALNSYQHVSKYHAEFPAYCSKHIHKYLQGNNNEHVSGDHIYHSKNVHHSFNIEESWDIRYSEILIYARDCMDVSSFGEKIEHMYECATAGLGSQSCSFCFTPVVNSVQLLYCDVCYTSKNCFGCIGLNRNENCILNKQYTKEEYEALVPKIIEKMRTDGEWGEFFPHSVSPFAYNETVAMDFFPLTKNEVLARGWQWHEDVDLQEQYLGPDYVVPEKIADVPDDITKQILRCSVTSRPYKIIPQELKFYRDMGIPVPRKYPDQRHKERMALRNPRKLWNRKCAKCQMPIATSYSPDRPEIVYCEECYLATVY